MINTTVYKNKEQQLHRALRKEGYSLRKSRKAVSIDNLGGYMIVNSYRNVVVAGSRYELSLDDVADWLEG